MAKMTGGKSGKKDPTMTGKKDPSMTGKKDDPFYILDDSSLDKPIYSKGSKKGGKTSKAKPKK